MKKYTRYEQIVSVSADLISKQGFDGVSFQQIADKVGLHKSSLFHYFKNKEELLLRILDKPFDEFYRNFQAIVSNKELEPEEKLKKAIDNHLTLLIAYRSNVKIFLNEIEKLSLENQRKHLIRTQNYSKDLEKVIVEMKAKGYFKGLDSKIVTFGVLGMTNWVIRWYKKTGPITVKEISNTFYRMLTKT